MASYENRIILFLDILGFKKHVSDTIDKDGNDLIEKIGGLNKSLERMGEIAIGIDQGDKKRIVTQFSDSIVISFQENINEQIYETLKTVSEIVIALMNDKIICRGALSYGKLIHNERIVFGPAMIDAYETESKAALYPRIIMDRNIYNMVRMYTDPTSHKIVTPPNITDYLKVDLDGKYYIDYFNTAYLVLGDGEELISYFKIVREIIISGSHFKQPDLKVKYGYMKQKYNNFIAKFNNDNDLLFLNKYGGASIEYFRSLKQLKIN